MPYYSHPCSYCNKIFYVFDDERYGAADRLAAGIKAHLQESGEDDKEHQFDYGETLNAKYTGDAMTESEEAPAGGYEIR